MNSMVASNQLQQKMIIKKATVKKEEVPVFLMKVSFRFHRTCVVSSALVGSNFVGGRPSWRTHAFAAPFFVPVGL